MMLRRDKGQSFTPYAKLCPTGQASKVKRNLLPALRVVFAVRVHDVVVQPAGTITSQCVYFFRLHDRKINTRTIVVAIETSKALPSWDHMVNYQIEAMRVSQELELQQVQVLQVEDQMD